MGERELKVESRKLKVESKEKKENHGEHGELRDTNFLEYYWLYDLFCYKTGHYFNS